MDLTTYQPLALATAKPAALDVTGYLIPGLIAEVGEVFGKIAKAARDDWNDARLRDELAAEWGDCAWMTAVALDQLGVHDEDHDFSVDPIETPEEALDALLDESTEARRAITTSGRIRCLRGVWFNLRDGAEIVTGRPFSTVQHLNLSKLADRADRDVIAGSGDHR